jgi:hypothetical protein
MSVATFHSTASALLTRVTEPGGAVRREAAHGIAADKPLTACHERVASGEHQFERGDRWLIAAREEVARMYQAPGLDWLERQAEVAENLVAERQAAAKRHR